VRVLVLNPGSSTLKAVVLEPPGRDPLAAIEVGRGDDASRAADRTAVVAKALDALAADGVAADTIDAVGHRVVHGGVRLTAAALVDDAVLAAIDAASELAPLHNPVAADTIRAARTLLPVPHVATFDTAFHATLPAEAIRYAVPDPWSAEWGVRRFGFHGLSVAWSTRRVGELLERPPSGLGLVVAHLGSGCSVTAVDGGRSVQTSMGMTPLEGLVMGTRAGSLDPGILLALLRDGRRTAEELADDLDHRSGLLGLSGRSADIRELLAAEAEGDEPARLALAVFVRSAAAGIAAAATALPALDALVFTGGIGEHSGPIRQRIVARLGVLGLGPLPDVEAAEDGGSSERDRPLSTGPKPRVLRVAAREDIVIADATVDLIAAGPARPGRAGRPGRGPGRTTRVRRRRPRAPPRSGPRPPGSGSRSRGPRRWMPWPCSPRRPGRSR
jgi:acetate kinase